MAENNDFLRVAVRWEYAGAGDQVNVYQLRLTEAAGTVSDSDVLEAVEDYLIALYASTDITTIMPDSTTHVDVFVFNETQSYTYPPIGAIAALNGLSVGEALPSGNAALVLGRTGFPRRVARKYLPTFIDTMVVGNVWTAAALLALNDFGLLWSTDFETTLGFTLSAWVGPDPGLNISPITSYSVRPVVAYQRRRKPGVGS